jgi:peptide/nickel transport system permease protein
MLQAITARVAQSIGVALVMSVIVFVGINYIGNPVYLLVSADAPPSEYERVTQMLGLDRPVYEQYWLFLTSLFKGGVANSFVSGRPALQLIFERFPATLELAVAALALSIVIGIPLGIMAGYRHDRLYARAIMTGSIFGFSVPSFWIGLVLIMVFAVQLDWLPAGGRGATAGIGPFQTSLLTLDGLRHLAMPALTLALFKISLTIRLTATGTREAMQADYVRFARAKGLSESRILIVHVARNILIPIVTVIGLEFAQLIAFSLVTETVFNWPGMGKLFIDSVKMLDRPVIVSYMVVIVMVFIMVNLIVDMLYMALDPKVRLPAERE